MSGADHITARPGFAAMMERIASNGVRTIVVETANRFARDLIVQETGYAMLKDRGIELIAADKPDAFLDDTPTAKLIRQVLGAVSEFEKAMVVVKLKGARDRKRATGVNDILACWRLEALNGPLDGGAKIQSIQALQVALEKAGASFV